MNLKEVTAYLKCFDNNQIYQMVHRKEIPYTNDGHRLVFDKDDIDDWNKKRLEAIEKDKDYFNMQEVMAHLELKKRTVYQYVCDEKIQHHKKGKLLRFNKAEIIKWENDGRPSNF